MSGTIPCPSCGAIENRVTDSRAGQRGSHKRRRQCRCGYRFTTLEMPAVALRREVETIVRDLSEEMVERIGSAVFRRLTEDVSE